METKTSSVTVEFQIYVQGRFYPIKCSYTFENQGLHDQIYAVAGRIAREGIFDSVEKTFITPAAILEIHWSYKETNEG
jgi:hypothetical protein